MDLAPGTILASRYRVSKRVGHGATGTVYRGHDTLVGEKVTLKVLGDEIAARPDRIRRWVRLARRVTHPNVCRIHDYVEDGSRRVLVMEHVKGCDLRRLLRRRGPLPRELACEIAIQAAQGLAAIHAAGMVHRDLTPRNVLYDATGRVKITDFRFAACLRSGGRRFVGKAEYVSPEQARREPVDAGSDLYALGALLFEMLTGAPPFRGATRQLTLLAHQYQPPPLAEQRAWRIPSRLLPVLEKVLRKRPQDRYPSAERLADALRAARSAGDAVALDPGPVPWALAGDADAWMGGTRRRAALGVAVTAAVVLAASAAWLWMRSRALDTAGARPVAQVTTPSPVETPALVEAARPAPAEPAAPPPREARPRRPQGPAATLAPAIEVATVREEAITPIPGEPAAEEDETEPASAISPEAPGRLQIGVRPWAAVTIDGRQLGETPLPPLALAPGVYTARLDHPGYQPLLRTVTVHSGETVQLQVDLGTDAVRRRDAAQRRE
jgi:serine/threonine-protein kinase